MRRARRLTKFALNCEHLESRQLLSIGQTGLAAGVLVNPFAASPQISVPATVSNYTPPSYLNIEIEFGTLGGLNQIQIAFLGTAPVFSPTPTFSFGGSGSGLGTSSGSAGNGTTGLTLPTGTTSSSSITPLNPNLTSSTNTPVVPVFLVPLPVAPPVVHLGPSAAPATTISNSTLISNLDEQPTSLSHFGQADTFAGQRVFMERLEIIRPSSSLIDYVEPFQPVGPVEAPQAQPARQGQQAPAPDAANLQPLPPQSDPNIDAALGVTDARVLTKSRDGDSSQPDEQFSSTNTSWSFSAIFGAAVVATGGYHLAMREADRLRGRWIPRWVGAERPTRRKTGLPPR